jgi:transcriptional regulator with PAS, ATPase and Fis domain
VRRIGSASPRKVDFRLLAASNVNLQQAVEEGRFREDLYFRLNEMLIHIPPLRERTEDIAELAGYFLRTTPVRVSKSRFDEFLHLALPILQSLPWPGNIRQLKNVCRRAAVMMLQESDLSSWPTWFPDLMVDSQNSALSPGQLKDLPGPIDSMNALALAYSRAPKHGRAEIVREALKVVGGEVNKVAEGLGISRSTVWRLGKSV